MIATTTMPPEISVSPSMQVLFLQLFNMAVQNISNNAPGLENVCVSNRDELITVRATMEKLVNDFDEQGKKLHKDFDEQGKTIQRLSRNIGKKFTEQIDEFKEVAKHSNSELKRMFRTELSKLGDQITAKNQTNSVCEGIRKENEELNKLRLQYDKEKEELNKLRLQQSLDCQIYKDAMKQLINDIQGTAVILMNATKAGDTALVKVLAEAGIDVDVGASNGLTPLHLAAYYGDHDTVQVLVDAGAKIEAKTTSGLTPLGFAANNGDLETCRVLLAAGANLQAKQVNGALPLHVAASQGNIAACQLFLDSGANIDALDNNKNTALHYAASLGQLDAVKFLLAQGANRNLKNRSGQTAKDVALEEGFTQVVAALSAA